MLAFVALRDGCVTNEDERREHARRRLANLKLPDKIVFLEKLPKGISGKIQCTALKEFEIVRRKASWNPRLALRGSCEP
jgi:acyl-coenzyme A synthetase/AMP-(fatty) acid ligase